MKLHDNKTQYSDAIRAASDYLAIAPEFVEKDYWICQILQNLSRHKDADKIVWKGGTSLSKAYNLIKRFSSDVDFAILSEGLSVNQEKKLVIHIGHDTTKELTEINIDGQTIKNNRFRKTFHSYDSTLTKQKNSKYDFLGNYVIVEINTFANPYPYERKEVETFITRFLKETGREEMIAEFDMESFTLNVLDKRRTLCEKLVSLLRFSFSDDPIAGLSGKIRHFYDLYYLTKEKDCQEYIQNDLPQELIDLIAHDKAEFDRPQMWKDADLLTSVLFTDYENTWTKLAPTYQTEVGALAYSPIPTPDEIRDSTKELFSIVETTLKAH